MKKTFRTILAGALAFLAVSCYDDSALRESISSLDKRVTDIEKTLNAEVGGINNLATRLAAAEEALQAANTAIAGANSAITAANSQITSILTRLDAIDGATDGKIANLEAAIKALQDADKTFATSAALAEAVAKIAVVNVAEKDGNVVLTLANGETVSLSKPLSNVDNNGLVTITADNMWAVVEADGTVRSLDIPVGHPDVTVEFTVAENGNLMYSVNGGEPQPTGVNTAELSGCHVKDVKEAEDGKSVTITIGEAVYTLPVYNPVPAVQIKSGKQFFAAGETKEIPVAIENVSNLLVMNQPYGWKAKINGANLTVTAPSETNADAEKEGVIVLHGEANGACVTAVLNVVLGEGIQLFVDDSGLITVINPIVVTTVNNWTGMESTGFMDFAIGYVKASIFESFASLTEFYNAVVNDYEGTYGVSAFGQNIGLVGEYDAETHPVDSASITIVELANSTWPRGEVVKGERYVVWAMPQSSDNPDGSEMLYTYYEPVEIEFNPTISFDEISLGLTVYGASTVYVGAISEPDIIDGTGSNDFVNYMLKGYGYGGPWAQFVSSGNFDALYGTPAQSGDVVSVKDLAHSCVPGTKYYVYVVPVIDGKSASDYVFEKDCRIFEYTTANLVEGAEEAELTLNEELTDFSSVTVDVTVPEGTTAYARFYSDGQLGDMTDAQLIAQILGNYPTVLEESGSVDETSLSDGETVVLVVLTTTADGKYAIAKGSFASKKYPIVDTITMTLDSITPSEVDGSTYYTAVFSVTGASKVAVYNHYSSAYATFTKYIMSQSTTFTYADVVDGKATVTFKSRGSSYGYMMYSAFNVDSSNNVESLMQYVSVKIAEKLQ